MIKKILVPTDGSTYSANGVDYAISLARQYGAHLRGLHVVDVKLLEGPFLRDISASLGTAPYVNYQGNIAMVLEERGKAALQAFEEASEAAGVPHDSIQVTGSIPGSIVEKSELMDLVVMGRGGEHSEWLEGLLGSTTEVVVRRARCPVLITERDSADLKRCVVPYDASVHARKALHISADLGENWHVPFDVLMIGEERGVKWKQEAEDYLEAHEVSVEYTVCEGDPGEVIVSYSKERKADLIVMGAYGHSKVRELVVGSTTAYAINHAPCPILLTR